MVHRGPNGVILCINGTQHQQFHGLLYHSYHTEPFPFENAQQMVHLMEQLYDYLNFPHPGNNERSFREDALLSKHGDIGTFIVRVQHRQNSSWQGRITWMEEDKTIYFRSIWEMIKLIESAVDTVSEQEEDADEAEPVWFGE